jgi:hypothetical protein
MATEEFTGEEWRRITPYRYEASSLGRIRRLGGGRELKPSISRTGYARVVLRHQGASISVTVHSAVASAFLGERPRGFVTNHKNGVKTDNRSSNLEWTTHSGNSLHAYRTGLREPVAGESNGKSVLTGSRVLRIRADYLAGVGVAALAAQHNVCPGTVYAALRSTTWPSRPLRTLVHRLPLA